MIEETFKEINIALKLIEANLKRIKADYEFEKKEKEKWYKKYIEEKGKK